MRIRANSAADLIDLRRPGRRPNPGMRFISLQAYFHIPFDYSINSSFTSTEEHSLSQSQRLVVQPPVQHVECSQGLILRDLSYRSIQPRSEPLIRNNNKKGVTGVLTMWPAS
jgi:hypothetical protein